MSTSKKSTKKSTASVAEKNAKESKEEKDDKDVKKSSSKKQEEKKATKKDKSEKKPEKKKEETTKKESPAPKEDKKPKETKKSVELEATEDDEKKSMGMIMGAFAILLIVVAAVAGYSIWGPGFEGDTHTNDEPEIFVDINGNEVEEDSPAAIIPRQIDGMMVAREEANEVPTCVMIENAAFGGVRPQSGLNSASVVYEVIVEGGITRFMAVFAGEDSDEVGPIRSARDTYLEFASEYNCMYTHAGGSYTAMTAIPRFGLRDLDALRESGFFWRDSSKYAPHNLYSSTENLEEAIVAHSWHLDDAPDYQSWNFVEAIGPPEEVVEEEAPETEETDSVVTEDDLVETVEETIENGEEAVNQLQILFGGSYNSQYDFNEEGNYYERTNGNVLQTDAATGETLRTNNIVVMHVGAGTSIEGKGRINWPVTGEGDVEIYHDGRVYYGTWKKPTRTERTQFYDADGELLPMVQGNTWVEVVPSHITVERS